MLPKRTCIPVKGIFRRIHIGFASRILYGRGINLHFIQIRTVHRSVRLNADDIRPPFELHQNQFRIPGFPGSSRGKGCRCLLNAIHRDGTDAVKGICPSIADDHRNRSAHSAIDRHFNPGTGVIDIDIPEPGEGMSIPPHARTVLSAEVFNLIGGGGRQFLRCKVNRNGVAIRRRAGRIYSLEAIDIASVLSNRCVRKPFPIRRQARYDRK